MARALRVSWLRRFGAPPVRAVFAALDAEALLDTRWNLIRDQIEASIAGQVKMIKAKHRETGFNPRLIVYILAETTCRSCLGSGHYHFYRGALTHDGLAIEDLARRILRVEYELGAYTNEDYEKSLEGMSELIAGSG